MPLDHIATAFSAHGQLHHEGETLAFIDLPALFGERLTQLPWVLRILLENIVRNGAGEEQRAHVAALFEWLATGHSEHEIPFSPTRILMHDTTSTPALVDVAAMRDALAEAGCDPRALNPVLPVDVAIDHSLAVEVFARPDAPVVNLQHELRRNGERYRFLRWAARVLDKVRIHPPGTGIMHTINLEQLATVATVREEHGVRMASPDTMLGTDSHTPMINGIGVLGWGVGGLEAQTVMFGMPTMLRIPEVTGIRLTGALPPGVNATDLALVVTHRLREVGVTGDFVEFFGPGTATLSASERAVVANMAPEYGATTGYFPVDANTLDYLRETGRATDAVALVETYFKRAGLWFDALATPRYTRTIQIDLTRVRMHIAGPTRPQDLLPFGAAAAALQKRAFTPKANSLALPRHAVALAAITSCTNTSSPRLLIEAGLLARKARRLKLTVPAWVKTSLAPGSPAAATYLARAGLIEDLDALGFGIVGYGCTTCIGNPGPLTDAIRQAQQAGACKAVAILSGNRNFPGRVHPDIELSFIMSPALVIAFGLAGNAEIDLERDAVQRVGDEDVFLRDLWPAREEVDAHLAQALDARDFARDFKQASANPLWAALEAPDTARFPWNPRSTALRRPPFAATTEGSLLGRYTAHPLMVLGDDVTTDHISPASAIPPDSLAADFLVARGESRHDLNVFASRRGNWEVMLRAAFHSKTLVNQLAPGAPVAHTLHVPSGKLLPVWEAAQAYRDAGHSLVVIAGERYGMGSSRDWAAKGQRLLGVRAVLAKSFERIHRSNLIGMGILPLVLPAGTTLAIAPGDTLEVEASADRLVPRAQVTVRIARATGSTEELTTTAGIETALEIELLKAGGVIPFILKGRLPAHEARP